ncbi:PRC and DUF2382 domain-containing protein [Georgenia sp. 10Sc9-8]|uniref:PRC and DUF2382 domain-containing protein n=1 Tax=Georgenia halotolerans TaxID=3028317 RepID=A0ABT5U0A0_9MICO|nr:PRC and DUF2382 domain-containing protein [Georgenia halotolerans]
MITTNELQRLADDGANVVTNDGSKIGSIGQLYVDEATNEPTWVTVKTGLFGSSESFVPLEAAEVRDGAVAVPYDKDTVKDAPRVDPDGRISREEEDQLYRHYNLQVPAHWDDDRADAGTGTTGTGTGTAAGVGAGTTADTAGGTRTGDDNSVVREEEQVDVGTRTREAGRVRLRKYEVTENVNKTVPVTREEVRVEREPVTVTDTDAARGAGNDEAEVTLHEDEVVVDKESKPVERVSLGTETVTDEKTVSEEVRKEQVETEADPNTRGRH